MVEDDWEGDYSLSAVQKGSSTPSGQSPVNNWAEQANQQVQSVHNEKHTNTLRGRLLTHNKEEERLISST